MYTWLSNNFRVASYLLETFFSTHKTPTTKQIFLHATSREKSYMFKDSGFINFNTLLQGACFCGQAQCLKHKGDWGITQALQCFITFPHQLADTYLRHWEQADRSPAAQLVCKAAQQRIERSSKIMLPLDSCIKEHPGVLWRSARHNTPSWELRWGDESCTKVQQSNSWARLVDFHIAI